MPELPLLVFRHEPERRQLHAPAAPRPLQHADEDLGQGAVTQPSGNTNISHSLGIFGSFWELLTVTTLQLGHFGLKLALC